MSQAIATAPPAVYRSAPKARLRRGLRRAGFWLSVAVIVSPAILVFLWMLSLSLKNEIDNLAYPPVFIPDPATLKNYVQVFTENSMGLYFWNSIVVSGRATRTLPAAVYNVLTFEQLAWGPLAAAAIIVTLPVLVLTIFIQKEIVAGLTHGGVKGA